MQYSKKSESSLNRLKTGSNKAGFRLMERICLFSLIWVLGACASMQNPTGGPKDINPPKVLKEYPKNLSKNFKAQEIKIEFDEFVKLNNAFAEISISPALEKPLEVKARKSELEIKIDEPLEANTTYTINFGKAIGDVNENNLLKNYSYVFSTGTEIDSLSITGNVKSALTNENLKEVTVFILPTSRDSLFGKKKASIYTVTDSAGNFKLSNLRADQYRIYALKESGADRIYQAGQDEIGFIDTPIDLNKNISNLKFRVFKEEPPVFKLLDRKIENDGKILLTFNKGLENLSVKELDNTKYLEKGIITYGLKMDSVNIWLPELTFDSLKVGIYSGDKLIEQASVYRNKRETLNRTPGIKDNLLNGKIKPNSNLKLRFTMPIIGLDSSKITLLADSVPVKGWTFTKVANSALEWRTNYDFDTGTTFNLKMSEGAFTGISGIKSLLYNKQFTVDETDNYGNLSLVVSPEERKNQYVVQLINDKQAVIREDVISENGVVNYQMYPSGKYTLRFVLDENRNGKWDAGSLQKGIQPEKMWNYEKPITLRANWDQEEKITIPKDL